MSFVKVLVNSRSPALGNGLTYQVKDEDKVEIGSLVRVPLRKQTLEGIIIELDTKHDDSYDVKFVAEVISNAPLLIESSIETAKWMSTHYMCTLRQSISPFLPVKRWSDLLPRNIKFIRLSDLDSFENIKGKRQIELIEYLREEEWVPLNKLRSDIDTPLATIKKAEESGIIFLEERSEADQLKSSSKFVEYPKLTDAQKDAYAVAKKSTNPSLLFGVTSSGKTEIYAAMIADVVSNGDQAILLVPEILLTEHSITRFQQLLPPERIAVIHSRLTPSERRHMWRECKNGSIDLVVGSRSSLFSPLPSLKLVVMDEEHEWTYKNEQTPRYHARSVAEELCKESKAKLLLGSATPSIESWNKAQNNEYTLIKLSERYNNQPFPEVTVVDLAVQSFEDHYPFSPDLLRAIKKTLDAGEQSVLFLNRKGHASALLCMECRRRVVSPDSQLPFTVYKNSNGALRLVDHTTNLQLDAPTNCPHCGSIKLQAVGAGTQKVEKILEDIFPNARLLRADSDTLTHPEHMRLLLKKMKEGHADILLGTQSVAKGLDLPNVTLAAVLVADVGLSLPHFRAGERIFQMLTQLTGRSGRSKSGQVIIQTFRPDCQEVRFSSVHDTEGYLKAETALRTKLKYPPASSMIRLLFRGPDCSRMALSIQKSLKQNSNGHQITASPTLFGGGKVWHILIRGDNPRSGIENISLEGIVVDIDPIECV